MKEKKQEMDHQNLETLDDDKNTDDSTSACNTCPNDTSTTCRTRNTADNKEDPVQLSTEDIVTKQLTVDLPLVEQVDYLKSSKEAVSPDRQKSLTTSMHDAFSTSPENLLVESTVIPNQRITAPEKDFLESRSETAIVQQMSESHIAACNLRVNLPPTHDTETHERKNVPNTDCNLQGNLPSRHTRNHVTVNELLCFIFNKMNKLPQDHIIKLCSDFYDVEEIDAGKHLLYSDTEHVRNSRLRYIKRKGENKKKNDLQDIMHAFNSIELCNMPTYVASDLGNLPPLTAYDTDVVGLHRDVQELKASMRLILESRIDIKNLTQSLNDKMNSLPTDNLQACNRNNTISVSAQTEVNTDDDCTVDDANESDTSFIAANHSSQDEGASVNTPRHTKRNDDCSSESVSPTYAEALQSRQSNSVSLSRERSLPTHHSIQRIMISSSQRSPQRQSTVTYSSNRGTPPNQMRRKWPSNHKSPDNVISMVKLNQHK